MLPSRVLITGINGLIGGILHRELSDTYILFGLDREGPFSDRIASVDIADAERLCDTFRRFAPLDAVIHLAGDSKVYADWEHCLSANIVGTRNVYEAARRTSVKRVVFASSNHVTGGYEQPAGESAGEALAPPPRITVRDPIRPDSDYGVSKAFGEALARFYCDRFGISSICLRIGSVLRDDDPTHEPRHLQTWLSHRDLIQLVERCLSADVEFGIYYGVSDNKDRFWSIVEATAELGYHPLDDAVERSKTIQ
ncbi:NAD-dependent epimerase/dehydratase family protein [Methylococcus mesophilus]|uniref:NAD-dependent epimerase/dehydratase family protein n=1 Tax=Methylococcus mesophilus TaxID=2993564 RepID=UPI00224B2B14|nr:NAD(P)-dependent oxidoreductase [Methylococcus mesophilus]UZR28058.1 NAD(P)-dependent oxidoreductase [Methylococcus mesophilus]